MLPSTGSSESTSWARRLTSSTRIHPRLSRVTDAMVQSEVARIVGFKPASTNTVYEVFIPSGYYSNDGTSTSCGGPKLSLLRVSQPRRRLAPAHQHQVLDRAVAELQRLLRFRLRLPIRTPKHFMVHESRETLPIRTAPCLV